MSLGDQKPVLVKKLTNQQQLLAILKDRSAPPKAKDPPFALQRQTEATALCSLPDDRKLNFASKWPLSQAWKHGNEWLF